jgi:hypothetical protein
MGPLGRLGPPSRPRLATRHAVGSSLSGLVVKLTMHVSDPRANPLDPSGTWMRRVGQWRPKGARCRGAMGPAVPRSEAMSLGGFNLPEYRVRIRHGIYSRKFGRRHFGAWRPPLRGKSGSR